VLSGGRFRAHWGVKESAQALDVTFRGGCLSDSEAWTRKFLSIAANGGEFAQPETSAKHTAVSGRRQAGDELRITCLTMLTALTQIARYGTLACTCFVLPTKQW